MVYLTRRERFCAAHRLLVDEWSAEKNYDVFGKCANPNWHGHNFNLFVTVKGIPDTLTGFVINVKDLGKIVKEHIIKRIDHKNLNIDVDFIPQGMQPTVENVAMLIWKELTVHLPENCELHCIKLTETENVYVEYYGE